jgi:membrane-bound inhibitor of C-type lysozyme
MKLRTLVMIAAAAALPVAAVAQPAAPSAPPMPKKVHLKYNCDNLKVPVTYDNVKGIAYVTYGSKRYALSQEISADGSRYLNKDLEWWEKGNTATLSSVHLGEADKVLTTCTAIPKK